MITMRAKTIEQALEIFKAAKPDATQMSARRYARRAGSHLSKDYSGGRGLAILGITPVKTFPFIEIHHLESGVIEVDWMIAVYSSEEDFEVFDVNEVSGYDNFVKSKEELSSLVAAEKERSLAKVTSEQIDVRN